jgi:salicylate hydroxylase
MTEVNEQEPATVAIVGGGIVGLVLAIALKRHVGITAEIYEKAHGFHPDVGAGMGMYPNGLRVIRDLDPALLENIRKHACPYIVRRWERHDNTKVVEAEESVLDEGEEDIQSVGIRRSHLQDVLFKGALEAGIKIHFEKHLENVVSQEDGLTLMTFEDGTKRLTNILFGADGRNSKLRTIVTGGSSKLEYTGNTCLMGLANCPAPDPGIIFITSTTTKCHAVVFPTQQHEQCFQFNVNVERVEQGEDQVHWGAATDKVSKDECRNLAEALRTDGWDERYIKPLDEVARAIKIRCYSLQPPLKSWSFGTTNRIVLMGDAAHPPLQYTGQGAQMGIEDAGVFALIMKGLCLDCNGELDLSKFDSVVKIWEKLRIPRTHEIINCAKGFGALQQRRAESEKFDVVASEKMQRDVFFHLTIPAMLPGAKYNYQEDVEKALSSF